MRYRRQLNQNDLDKNKKFELTPNMVVLLLACVSVILVVGLYLVFGPNIYHQPPVVIGQETVVSLSEEKQAIPVMSDTVEVTGSDIFYRYAEPRGQGAYLKPDVLLLHGSKYASSTWKGLGTLQILAYYGYRTFAIDLPGYKLSTKADPPQSEQAVVAWMKELVGGLGLKKYVLVVPSVSGRYGLPLLLGGSDEELVGFVAIAPAGVEKYARDDYQHVSIPVLSMWGERDNSELQRQAEYWLGLIPESTPVMIPHGEHAPFVGNPKDFHAEILRYLTKKISLGEADVLDTDTDTAYYTDTDDDYVGYQQYDTDTELNYDSVYGQLAEYFGEQTDYEAGWAGDDYDAFFGRYDNEDTDLDSVIGNEIDTDIFDDLDGDEGF